MKDETLHAMTAMVVSATALLKAPYGDEGAVANMKSAVHNLQTSDTAFEDQEFVDACNELATTAALKDPKVVVAEVESPKKERNWWGGEKHKDVSAKDSGLV